MVDVVARIKAKGKLFEIIVDCDKALALKKQGKIANAAVALRDVLAVDNVFSDYKKGFKASSSDLKEVFGTDNIYEVAAKIILEGEIVLPQEYRDKAREEKMKQIVDFLSRNCVDPRTGAPYTPERISAAMKQAGVKIEENKPIDEQALIIIKNLSAILPIKIEIKKIKIVVPPAYVARVYGFLKNFTKEKEDWLSDGSFSCIINLPAGMQLDFYDKLNNATHGSAVTEEIE
ncbi:MAG: ribosome assembly factor SBDS [Candidatus Pacearchaeota archaeon]|nr:ribosome assembly factor SBDS [Candidatus Pacearchaeota archaeon]